MKHIFCFIIIVFMLVACGDKNLPQECNDVFEISEEIHTKLETSHFANKIMAATYKKDMDEFNINFRKALSRANYEKQAFSCKPIAELLKSQLDRLDNVKSEAEVKKLLPNML